MNQSILECAFAGTMTTLIIVCLACGDINIDTAITTAATAAPPPMKGEGATTDDPSGIDTEAQTGYSNAETTVEPSSDTSESGGTSDTGTTGQEPFCPPEEPSKPLPCPAACTGGCQEGACVIDCNDTSDCQLEMIVCPEGWPCRVECGGISSCQEAFVQCPSAHSCAVSCSNTSACQGGLLKCGSQACTAKCDGIATSLDGVECGDACSCDNTCT